MFVHVVDAARTRHSKVVIRTVDTDVLVLAVPLVDNIYLRRRVAKLRISPQREMHLSSIPSVLPSKQVTSGDSLL